MACQRSSRSGSISDCNRPAAVPSRRSEPTVHHGAQAAEGVRFWGGDWRNCRGRNSYGLSHARGVRTSTPTENECFPIKS